MRLMTVQWFAVVALFGFSVGCAPGTLERVNTSAPEKQPSSSAQQQATAPTKAPAASTQAAAPTPAPTVTPVPSGSGQTGMLLEPGPAADLGYRLGWASPVQLLPRQEITSVTVQGDMVFVVEEPKNIVTALNAADGTLSWKINLGSEIETLFAPSRDGKQVFIHSATRFFTLDARSGEVNSVAALESPVSSKAIYSPEARLAIMSGTDGLVFAHNVDSNFPRWRYRLANRIVSHGVFVGQDLFVTDSGGTYALLETASGLPLWRSRTLGPISAAPTFQGSEIITASHDGKLYALNRSTGQDTWIYLDAAQELTAPPVALGRLILQPLAPNPGIIAIDSINGTEVWRSDVAAKPILKREKDVILHTEGGLISLSLNDGKVIGQAATQSLQTVLPIGNDGGLLLVSPKGRLLKLSPR